MIHVTRNSKAQGRTRNHSLSAVIAVGVRRSKVTEEGDEGPLTSLRSVLNNTYMCIRTFIHLCIHTQLCTHTIAIPVIQTTCINNQLFMFGDFAHIMQRTILLIG